MNARPVEMLMAGILAVGLSRPAPGFPDEAAERPAARAAAKTAAPATSAAETWREIEAAESDLGHLIQTRKLDRLHEAAYTLRDLVAALPVKSQNLSAEAQAKLRADVKYVATLASRLDEAGDAGDAGEAEASFKQMQSVLASIEKLYPQGSLR